MIKNKYSVPYEFGLNATSMDAWGRPKSYTDFSLFHGLFTFNIPNSIWHTYENGLRILNNINSTQIISVNGKLEVHSGLNEGHIESRRSPKYQPNRGHLFSTSVGLPNLTALAERDFGLGNDENGVYFRLKSDGFLYAVLLSGGIQKIEERINIPFEIDLSKGQLYDINFQWRGVGNYKFMIGNPKTGRIELVHTINFIGTLDNELSMENPALPVHFKSTNLGDEAYLWSGCVDITSEGGGKENRVYNSLSTGNNGVLLSITAESPLMLIKVNETFNGKINTRDIALRRVTASCTDDYVINVYVTGDPAAFTGTTFTNKGMYDNIKFALDGNIVIADNTNFRNVYSTHMAVGNHFTLDNPDESVGEFYLTGGDYLLVSIDSRKGGSAWATIEWEEV